MRPVTRGDLPYQFQEGLDIEYQIQHTLSIADSPTPTPRLDNQNQPGRKPDRPSSTPPCFAVPTQVQMMHTDRAEPQRLDRPYQVAGGYRLPCRLHVCLRILTPLGVSAILDTIHRVRYQVLASTRRKETIRGGASTLRDACQSDPSGSSAS